VEIVDRVESTMIERILIGMRTQPLLNLRHWVMTRPQRRAAPASRAGFTLLELTVGLGIMMVLGSVIISLFDMHVKVYRVQQEVTEMNLGLRTGLDLISADLLNAGANLSVPGSLAFPFPVLVQNNVNGNFDSITIYQGYSPSDPRYMPPTTTLNISQGNQVASSSTLFINPIPGDTTGAQTAALLPNGSFLVIIDVNPSDPSYGKIAPITLTQDSATNGGGNNLRVKLNHNPTGAQDGCSGLTVVPSNKLAINFPDGSLVVKLAPPVTYSVSTANPARPVLTRTTTASCASSSISATALTEDVLGFSQRAQLANGQLYDDPALYYGTDSSGNPVAAPNDYSLIKALEVTIVGRTKTDRIDAYKSAIDPTRTFRVNTYSTTIVFRNKSVY
jgi:type II secretory pathway pseudopilin PulG